MNSDKTKYMSYNLSQEVPLKTNDGTALEEVSDFKYLGARMASTKKYIKMHKGVAWRACSKLTKSWKSTLPKQLKHRIFAITVESVLLYYHGCEAWTIANKVERDLDGCYTRMLRTVYNIHWKPHMTNKELYGIFQNSHKRSDREEGVLQATSCFRNKNEPVSTLIHWIPKH